VRRHARLAGQHLVDRGRVRVAQALRYGGVDRVAGCEQRGGAVDLARRRSGTTDAFSARTIFPSLLMEDVI
jgi:hypothetical protein